MAQLDGEGVQEGHCDPSECREGAMAQGPVGQDSIDFIPSEMRSH